MRRQECAFSLLHVLVDFKLCVQPAKQLATTSQISENVLCRQTKAPKQIHSKSRVDVISITALSHNHDGTPNPANSNTAANYPSPPPQNKPISTPAQKEERYTSRNTHQAPRNRNSLFRIVPFPPAPIRALMVRRVSDNIVPLKHPHGRKPGGIERLLVRATRCKHLPLIVSKRWRGMGRRGETTDRW